MKNVRRFVVITRWGEETGFRLGGATTIPVAGPERFNEELARLIDGGEVGMIGLSMALEEWIDDDNRRRLARSKAPLIARFRYPEAWSQATTAVGETEDIAFRATGFHFRIRL